MHAERIPDDVCGEATFVNWGNEIESKGFQLPAAEMSLIKLIGAANRQVARDSSKFSALEPQVHQVRRRSDERENTKAKTVVQNYKLLLLLRTIQILWERAILSILQCLK